MWYHCTAGRGTEKFVQKELSEVFKENLGQVSLSDGKVYFELNDDADRSLFELVTSLKSVERVFAHAFKSYIRQDIDTRGLLTFLHTSLNNRGMWRNCLKGWLLAQPFKHLDVKHDVKDLEKVHHAKDLETAHTGMDHDIRVQNVAHCVNVPNRYALTNNVSSGLDRQIETHSSMVIGEGGLTSDVCAVEASTGEVDGLRNGGFDSADKIANAASVRDMDTNLIGKELSDISCKKYLKKLNVKAEKCNACNSMKKLVKKSDKLLNQNKEQKSMKTAIQSELNDRQSNVKAKKCKACAFVKKLKRLNMLRKKKKGQKCEKATIQSETENLKLNGTETILNICGSDKKAVGKSDKMLEKKEKELKSAKTTVQSETDDLKSNGKETIRTVCSSNKKGKNKSDKVLKKKKKEQKKAKTTTQGETDDLKLNVTETIRNACSSNKKGINKSDEILKKKKKEQRKTKTTFQSETDDLKLNVSETKHNICSSNEKGSSKPKETLSKKEEWKGAKTTLKDEIDDLKSNNTVSKCGSDKNGAKKLEKILKKRKTERKSAKVSIKSETSDDDCFIVAVEGTFRKRSCHEDSIGQTEPKKRKLEEVHAYVANLKNLIQLTTETSESDLKSTTQQFSERSQPNADNITQQFSGMAQDSAEPSQSDAKVLTEQFSGVTQDSVELSLTPNSSELPKPDVRILKQQFRGIAQRSSEASPSDVKQFTGMLHTDANNITQQSAVMKQQETSAKSEKSKTGNVSGVTFRMSCKFSGKVRHKLNIQKTASQLGVLVSKCTKWKTDVRNPMIELSVHMNDEMAVVGIPLTKDPLSKRSYLRHRGLRSSVAWIMARLLHIQRGETVLDPMCGKGTILLEAAKGIRQDASYIGIDKDPTQLESARENVEFAGVAGSIQLIQGDGTNAPLHASSVDKVVTDAPFGDKHLTEVDIHTFYMDLLVEMAMILKPGGKLVLLTGKHMMEHLKRSMPCLGTSDQSNMHNMKCISKCDSSSGKKIEDYAESGVGNVQRNVASVDITKSSKKGKPGKGRFPSEIETGDTKKLCCDINDSCSCTRQGNKCNKKKDRRGTEKQNRGSKERGLEEHQEKLLRKNQLMEVDTVSENCSEEFDESGMLGNLWVFKDCHYVPLGLKDAFICELDTVAC